MKKYVKIILSAILLAAATTAVSYYLFSQDNKNIFLASLNNNFSENKVKAGIVSHHLLVKDLIENFYNKISSDENITILLVSPDHYNNFFPTGKLYTQENSVLSLEHGISTQIPFIEKYFPNAEIISYVLNNNAKLSDFENFGEKLNSENKNSILIVSSDFSHNLSYAESQRSDKKSVEILKDLNLENIKDITTDCKTCMAVLYGFLGEDKENYKFNLIDNKILETSYIFGTFEPKEDLQILFTGDLMFDRGIRYYANKNGSNEFIFNEIYPVLANQDLVVSNLEGPITNNKSTSAGSAIGSTNNFIFTFDKSVAKTLYAENIRLVNLGNNHILNFGKAGLKSTENYLLESGVNFFGGPDSNRSIVKEVGNYKIAFISYNEFFGSAKLDEAETIAEIQNLKKDTDLIVVLPHWGVEYTTEPTEEIRDMAHQFINAGADLIIGTHPHVIQSIEDYNGKKIYYSLGNFVFDQYFGENVRNGLGLILKINPKTKALKFEELSFYLQSNGQTILKK